MFSTSTRTTASASAAAVFRLQLHRALSRARPHGAGRAGAVSVQSLAPLRLCPGVDVLLRTRSLTTATHPKPAPAPATKTRPLEGIKVVDLTRVLAGPLATMMLIESAQGDDTRSWNPPSAPFPPKATPDGSGPNGIPRPDLPEESAYFLQANRNKRSITLNLKSKHGQEVARRLVQDADVLVENYVTGKLDKFGLGWEQVKAINPRLVYCSITGYGSTGPYAHAPGYDVVVEAEAGLMHITGEAGGRPVKASIPGETRDRPSKTDPQAGVAVTDVLTGHYAHSGVLAALLLREKTGEGSRVECSLFESQIASLVNIGSNYLIAGQEATRWGTSHPSIVPYQVFPTRDSFIMLSAGNDGQFVSLAGALGRSEWVADERFATNAQRVRNRAAMVAAIEEALAEADTAEWCERLRGKGPINNIAQTFAHPQAIARKVVQEVEHPRAGRIKLAAPAVSYNGEKPKIYRPPPVLGEHTEEVLAELGFSETEVRAMQQDGSV